MTESKRHLVTLARVAAVVAVGDWLTKALAARLVTNEPVVFTEYFRFSVVHNHGSAFGLSAGAYTWQLNFVLTLTAILLMIPVARDLTHIDKAAPRALGLIMGGALGNLASLIVDPPGVVDFIYVGIGGESAVVFNFADIAAYVGLAMMTRTGFLIVAEIRRRAQPIRTHVRSWTPVPAFHDREVPLEPALADAPVSDPAVVIPRPESVRRAELGMTDPKVIDIRPHLPQQPAEPRAD